MSSRAIYSLNLEGKNFEISLTHDHKLEAQQVGVGAIKLVGMTYYDRRLPDLQTRLVNVFKDSRFIISKKGALKIKPGYSGGQNIAPRKQFAAVYLNDVIEHELRFSKEHLSYGDWLALLEVIKGNTHIDSISLACSGLNNANPSDLLQLLEICPLLKQVVLFNNEVDGQHLEALMTGLGKHYRLEKLFLGKVPFEEKSMRALAKTVQSSQVLQKLDIYNTNISDNLAEILSCGLVQNKSLKIISFDESTLKASEVLVNSLLDHPCLEVLDLQETGLNILGIHAVREMLSRTNTLRELQLGFNEIDDEGAASLAEGLKRNKSLKKVNLYHNKLSIHGAGKVVASLNFQSKIEEVDFSCNSITNEDITKIFAVLSTNPFFKKLSLKDNPIENKDQAVEAANQARDKLRVSWETFKNRLSCILFAQRETKKPIGKVPPELMELFIEDYAEESGFSKEFLQFARHQESTDVIGDVEVLL